MNFVRDTNGDICHLAKDDSRRLNLKNSAHARKRRKQLKEARKKALKKPFSEARRLKRVKPYVAQTIGGTAALEAAVL